MTEATSKNMSDVKACSHTLLLLLRALFLQQVCDGVEVTAYYAGHVLGAAMLHVRVGSESLVYTGKCLCWRFLSYADWTSWLAVRKAPCASWG